MPPGVEGNRPGRKLQNQRAVIGGFFDNIVEGIPPWGRSLSRARCDLTPLEPRSMRLSLRRTRWASPVGQSACRSDFQMVERCRKPGVAL